MLAQASGILGLLLITVGVLLKKRAREDIFYILGGIFLLLYSISIGDMIFIVLQIIFIVAALFDFIRIQKKRS
ncbi:MAG: hypothetical protein OXR66_02545 [Candidatus Woesearchaeota archaeon]|nr:hypothetical protein [Candidatus Woesearchaeota archaeon]